jgi:hypothetical protein
MLLGDSFLYLASHGCQPAAMRWVALRSVRPRRPSRRQRSSMAHTSLMTEGQPEASVANPSPAAGLSLLGLVAFVIGGSLLMNPPVDSAGVARTGGLLLVGVGIFALMAGATALGVLLARSDR